VESGEFLLSTGLFELTKSLGKKQTYKNLKEKEKCNSQKKIARKT